MLLMRECLSKQLLFVTFIMKYNNKLPTVTEAELCRISYTPLLMEMTTNGFLGRRNQSEDLYCFYMFESLHSRVMQNPIDL